LWENYDRPLDCAFCKKIQRKQGRDLDCEKECGTAEILPDNLQTVAICREYGLAFFSEQKIDIDAIVTVLKIEEIEATPLQVKQIMAYIKGVFIATRKHIEDRNAAQS
jgi:hypothetical protein